jgi:acyl carrier protein
VLEKIHAYLLSTNQSAGSSQNAVEQMLKNICDSLIPEKQIQLDDNIFEIGTTSIILAQLHQRIEETYPGILEVTDFFDYPTLKQLSAYIHSKQ